MLKSKTSDPHDGWWKCTVLENELSGPQKL